MNKSTAQKLKDKGYPQHGKGRTHGDSTGTLYYPTTDELFDWLGDALTALTYDPDTNQYIATSWKTEGRAFGSTPQDALGALLVDIKEMV